MTRSKKKKADCGHHIDRISNLPSNVIDGILKHLNIRDLVRTSILSRKWRYMWTSVPQLAFGKTFFDICKRNNHNDPEILRFIIEVLLLHHGPVYKFTLHLPNYFMCIIDFLEKLILFLSRSGIKDLELENKRYSELSYQVPFYVFFLNELTNFRLCLFELSVPPNFCGLKRLLDLKLEYVTFESGGLDSLISGCPLLENLTISFCSGFECIDLSAPTLKVVCINFEENIKSIILKNAKNLIDLTLVDHAYEDDDDNFKVTVLIKSLPKLQRLVMSKSEFKIMSATGVIQQTLLESFSSLEYLKLVRMDLYEREGLMYIFSVLKTTPDLVELVIESGILDGGYDVRKQESDQPEELECDGCFLVQLRTVKIVIINTVKHALTLIRFILANCPSLETLSFDIYLGFGQAKASMLLRISQDLLRMKRASHKVQVEFTHSYNYK